MNDSKNKLKVQKDYQNGALVGSETQRPKRELVVLTGTPTSSFSKRKELVVLRGKTSSQVNQALKAKNPYPARVFLKTDNQDQDIPTFFRIREQILCSTHKKYFSDLGWRNCCPWYCHGNLGDWIRPQIKTGSQIEVRGYFNSPKNGSDRPSFTAYSYQLVPKKPRVKKLPHFQEQVQGFSLFSKRLELEKVRNHDQ